MAFVEVILRRIGHRNRDACSYENEGKVEIVGTARLAP